MSVIVYFHGYGSNGSSRTSKLIQEAYPNHTVVSKGYNTKNADDAAFTLDGFIRGLKPVFPDQDIIFVGTSLGGFFANYFSNIFKFPTILINPCLDPHIRLEKYNKNGSVVDCKSFEKYVSDDTHFEKVVVLGVQDEIIHYDTFLSKFVAYKSVFIKNEMKHRVSNIDEIKSALDIYL